MEEETRPYSASTDGQTPSVSSSDQAEYLNPDGRSSEMQEKYRPAYDPNTEKFEKSMRSSFVRTGSQIMGSKGKIISPQPSATEENLGGEKTISPSDKNYQP